MRRSSSLLLAALLLASGAFEALATTKRLKDVACPVCEHGFKAWVISSYTTGGPDFDFCPHIRGEQVLPYQVWTCPGCRYSGWAHDVFEKGVKPETAGRIRGGLEPLLPIAADASQESIPAWVKFDLAVRVREMEGAPAAEVAHLRLCGAWATRVEAPRALEPLWRDPGLAPVLEAAFERLDERAATLPTDLPGGLGETDRAIAAARAILAEAAPEGPKARDRIPAGFVAAYVLRFRGELPDAAPALERLAARADAEEPVKESCRALLAGIPRERSFLEAWVEAPLAEDPAWKPEEAAMRAWQRADVLRRLGRFAEARDESLAVLARTGTPTLGALLARRMLRDGPTAAPPEVLAAAWEKAEETAFLRLSDPATAEAAARDLEQVPFPGLADRAAGGLASPEAKVRAAAARATAILQDPAPETVEALEKAFLGDPEGPVREAAGEALLRFAAERSRAAFAKAADTEDRHVRHAGVEGLGLVGDASSVAVLLGTRSRESQECLPALRRLANRNFTTVTDAEDPDGEGISFESWWRENRERPRAEWVAQGFRSAGLAVDAADRGKAVPALIEALADRRDWIRVNALRELRALTGRSAGWAALRDRDESPRDLKGLLAGWRRWWRENGGK